MKWLEVILRQLAKLQKRFGIFILVFFLAMTVFLGYNIRNIELQSDFNELMPQHLPIFQLNNKITDKFGGQDSVFILLMLDDELESRGTPDDIRDPRVMEYVVMLEDALRQESAIESVSSIAPLVRAAKENFPELNAETMSMMLDSSPEAAGSISDDYKKTIMMVKADVGGSEERVQSFIGLIEDKIDALSTPPGTKVMITGSPSIRVTIVELLKHDSVYTLVIASAIIFLLLIVMQRSFTQAAVIFTPIMLGLIWTLGSMGLFGIKLTIVTAGLGAMILGLGVEYGVFMLMRYKEERDNGRNQLDSIMTSVPAVGSSVLGSGTTTIIGFLALTLSIMPLLQKLGLSLALGIFFSIIAAVVVEPIIMLLEEDFERWNTKRMKRKYAGMRQAQKVRPR